jgi:hypothetical protein
LTREFGLFLGIIFYSEFWKRGMALSHMSCKAYPHAAFDSQRLPRSSCMLKLGHGEGAKMAQYKYSQFLKANTSYEFDVLHEPGSLAPYSGIYRCAGCEKEEVSVLGKPLPPQNHHQHLPGQGLIRWQLIVSH